MAQEEKLNNLAESLKKYGMVASETEAISRAEKIMEKNKERVKEETNMLKIKKDDNMESKNTYTKEQIKEVLQKFADKFSEEINKLNKEIEDANKKIEDQNKKIEILNSSMQNNKVGEEKSLKEMMDGYKVKEEETAENDKKEEGKIEPQEGIHQQLKEEERRDEIVEKDKKESVSIPETETKEETKSKEEIDLTKIFNVNK